MDNNKVPDYIIERVQTELGQYPCILQTNYFKEDAVSILEKNSDESWFNHYSDDGKFFKLEGLLKYSDSGIHIYYKRKSSDENVFRFVFLINSNQKDTCVFMIHKLKQYKIQDFYANSNISTT
jgi:hypothetical protein